MAAPAQMTPFHTGNPTADRWQQQVLSQFNQYVSTNNQTIAALQAKVTTLETQVAAMQKTLQTLNQ